jgi:hypothetical protein
MAFPFICMYGTIPAYVNRTVVQTLFVLLYTLWPCPHQPSAPGSMGAFFYFVDTLPEVLIIGALIFIALAVLES